MGKYTEKRPWGIFERFTFNEVSTVKILTIKPKQKLSLQFHNHRREFWKFLDNPAKITIGGKKGIALKNDEFVIEPKENHRIEALDKPVRILEISLGKFEEEDEKRIEDIYGRE